MDINDVARLANVSRATVSRYLNNGYISEEKRKRVAEVIAQTGYKPSRQARILRTGKTGMLGVITPMVHSSYSSRIIDGIASVVNVTPYQILFGNSDMNVTMSEEFLSTFSRANMVDGIIVISMPISLADNPAIRQLTVPYVLVGQIAAEAAGVTFDIAATAQRLTVGLSATSRHMVFMGPGRNTGSVFNLMWRGFVAGCEQANVCIEDDACVDCGIEPSEAYEAVAKLMRRRPQTDCIVCSDDRVAAGALAYMYDQGISVPQQVQVTGVGNASPSSFYRPSITTIDCFHYKMGVEAAELLLGIIQGTRDPKEHVSVASALVQRASSLPID